MIRICVYNDRLLISTLLLNDIIVNILISLSADTNCSYYRDDAHNVLVVYGSPHNLFTFLYEVTSDYKVYLD